MPVFLVVGAALGLASAGISLYQGYEANKQAKEDADKANAAAIAKNNADWEANKRTAELAAKELDRDAAQTQVSADQTRNTGNQQLATQLGQNAIQSQQANLQANAIAVNASRQNSSVAAGIGASGVKSSGSAAELAKEIAADGSRNLDEARKSVLGGIRSTASGAALGAEQIGNAYGGAMYNKDSMLRKAQEIRTSYAPGGIAYSQYQAGMAYQNDMFQLQKTALDREKERLNLNAIPTLLTGAFSGANAGVNFADTAARFKQNPTLTWQNGGGVTSWKKKNGIYFDQISGVF